MEPTRGSQTQMLKGLTKHQQLNYKRSIKRQREGELAADAA